MMAIDYSPLERIAEMNFSQMRKFDLNESQTMAATNESILFFVNNLNSFFNQFSKNRPDKEHLAAYRQLMTSITDKINESEYQYFLSKYLSQNHNQSTAQQMAQANCLQSYKDIPNRMQYWAASPGWGSSIRNPKEHRMAVKNMDDWAERIEKLPKTNSAFFKYIDEVEQLDLRKFKIPSNKTL